MPGGPFSRCWLWRSLGGCPHLAFDLHHFSCLRVKEIVADLVPATQVFDREQAGRDREIELLEHFFIYRTVALLPEDMLSLRCIQEVNERLRLVRVFAVGGHRYGVLYAYRLIRHHVVDVLARLLGGDGFVLVGEQRVTLSADESLERFTGALVLHRNVVEELVQVLEPLLLRLPLLDLGPVARHDVPTGTAGGERVGGDHLYPGLGQVVPVLDILRVTLPNGDDDHRVGDHAIVLVLVPIRIDEPGFDEACHIRLERELHHVGRQSCLHSAALLTRATVRSLELYSLASIGLLESGYERVVGRFRRRVGHQAEGGAPTARGSRGASTAEKDR